MKPNIVIIMADQLRFDVLGKGFTPNIDALWKDSVVFDRAYTSCPLCVPARGALFTGIYPGKNGSLINPWEPHDAAYGNVSRQFPTLYEMLESDWESIHSGKQHLFTEGGKLEDRPDGKTFFASTEKTYKEFLKENGKRLPGGARFRTLVPEMVDGKLTKFSRYSTAEYGVYDEGEEFYFDGYFTARTLEALKNRKTDRPLFLSLMFLAPHPPFEIPEPWYGKVDLGDFTLPENVGAFYPYQSPLQLYNLPGIVGSRYSREHWRNVWRVYLGLVSMMDNYVGMVVNELKEQGIYDNSIIVFTSDHGEMLGSHSLFQKMCMYEEAVRVPLSIKYPSGCGIGHRRVDSVVRHVDLVPTICECIGLDGGNYDGKSLLPLSKGKCQTSQPAFIQYDGNGARSNFQRAVVKDDYKLIVDFFKDEVFFELYDLANDGQETENLAFNPAFDAKAVELASLLAAHMVSIHDTLPFPEFNLDKFRSDRASYKVPQ